jgi:hypothetical protein
MRFLSSTSTLLVVLGLAGCAAPSDGEETGASSNAASTPTPFRLVDEYLAAEYPDAPEKREALSREIAKNLAAAEEANAFATYDGAREFNKGWALVLTNEPACRRESTHAIECGLLYVMYTPSREIEGLYGAVRLEGRPETDLHFVPKSQAPFGSPASIEVLVHEGDLIDDPGFGGVGTPVWSRRR